MNPATVQIDAGVLAGLSDPDELVARLRNAVGGAGDERGAEGGGTSDAAALTRSLIELAAATEQLAIDDVAAAVKSGRLVVSAAERLGLPAAEARARRGLAQALCYANDFEAALEELHRATALEERHAIPGDSARAKLTLVHVLVCTGRLEEAVAAGRAARELALGEGRTELAARADVNIGVCLRMQGRCEEALEHFGRARPVFAGEAAIAAQIDSNAAEALMDLDRYGEAEGAFQRALAGLEGAGAVQGAAIVEGNLGDLAVRRGWMREALEHFERARRGMERTGAPTEAARLEAERIETLLALGMTLEAVASFEHVGPLLRRAGLKAGLARALVALGRGLVRLQRFDAAAAALDEAEALFGELGSAAGAARASLARARLLMARGDCDGAAEVAGRVADGAESLPADRAAGLALMAEALARGGRFDAASAAAERGLELAQRVGVYTLRPVLRRALARAHAGRGEGERAASRLREAADEVERLRATLPPERFRSAFQGEHAGVYAEWFDAVVALGAGATAGAFEVMERSRGRSLLDAIGTVGAGGMTRASAWEEGPGGQGRQGDDTPVGARKGAGEGAEGPSSDSGVRALLDEVAEQRAGVAALYNELEDPSLERADRARRGDWLARLSAREAAIGRAEARLAATGRFASALGRPAGLAEVQSALGGAVLVSFFAGPESVSAVVATRESARLMRAIASTTAVRTALGDFDFQVTRAITRGFPGGRIGAMMERDAQSALATLADLVWRPIASEVGERACVVVPSGVLQGVPFAALRGVMAGTDGDVPRGEIAPTVTTPSASIMLALRQRAAAAEGGDAAAVDLARRPGVPHAADAGAASGALVVGASESLAPRAEEEARRIAEILGGADTLLGRGATRGAFLRASRGRRVIHIASHATFNGRDPLASGIRFVDGWLTPRDLAALDLGGAVVVLSACETGRTRADAAEDAEGFVRSLLLAGASQVVMSLWPIHDESAVELMADLYSSWYVSGAGGAAGGAHGDAPPGAEPAAGPLEEAAARGARHCPSLGRALVRAQEGLRRRCPHPAAWAPFVCVGYV